MSFKIEAGTGGGAGGPDRRGQDDHHQPDSALLRSRLPASVKIDGIDIRQFQQKSLRQQISFVLQETLLFHGPVWQNIAYGKPEPRARRSCARRNWPMRHEFIDKMPDGYDTMVGERGVTLSGGQRQRIAIARAVIRNTPILILDEPTSGLDCRFGEAGVRGAGSADGGQDAIVIAHRLSTIRRADMIFVVKDGAIVERGKHEELMEKNGLYAELHNLQFRDEAAEALSK